MARILICHVPKDGSAARDLGAALMGRGHFVSFDGEPDAARPERSSRLRQFEAVIVLWTEHSWQNVGLTEIATEMLPLNLLVPLRSESLPTTRLPLMFRKLNILVPRDVDGIARLVARLSTAATSLRDMAEREAVRRTAQAAEAPKPVKAKPWPVSAALSAPKRTEPDRPAQSQRPQRPPQSSPPAVVEEGTIRARPLSGLPEVDIDAVETGARREPSFGALDIEHINGHRPRTPDFDARSTVRIVTAEDLAQAVEAGLLVHHIPDALWLGAPTMVELTLGREVLAGLMQPGAGMASQSLETLSVSLYGSSEAFEIERQSERTQFVSARHIVATRDPETFGRWAWLVTPRSAGPHDLVLRVSALLRDRNGVPAPVALPDRRIPVEIQVPEGQSLVSALAGWYRR